MPADAIGRYLTKLSSKLGLGGRRRDEIVKELATHLGDATRDYQSRGLPLEEAQRQALEAFGDPKEISRKLQWVHGFGRYSNRPLIDALLGSLPFLLAAAAIAVESAVLRLGPINYGVFVWIGVIGVAVYALKEAVPAWTVTWVGFAHFLVLFLVFVSTFGTVGSILGLSWPFAYTIAFVVTAAALLVFTILIARKGVEATLLFLLPLAISYASIGYEDAAPSHRLLMTVITALFAFVFSFAYLMTRGRHPLTFAAFGFVFYNALYIDITLRSPAPLGSHGLTLVGIRLLMYVVPLLLISSPAYYYLKRPS